MYAYLRGVVEYCRFHVQVYKNAVRYHMCANVANLLFSWRLGVNQVKGTAVHFWAWGTEQPRLKCHAPEKLGPLAVSGEKQRVIN